MEERAKCWGKSETGRIPATRSSERWVGMKRRYKPQCPEIPCHCMRSRAAAPRICGSLAPCLRNGSNMTSRHRRYPNIQIPMPPAWYATSYVRVPVCWCFVFLYVCVEDFRFRIKIGGRLRRRHTFVACLSVGVVLVTHNAICKIALAVQS